MSRPPRIDDFSVALVGYYPPPIGGITIHIKRLYRAMKARGIQSTVFDIGDHFPKSENIIPVNSFYRWLPGYLVGKMNDIVHYHGQSWLSRTLLLLVKLRLKRIIFTFHSLRDELGSLSLFNRLLIWFVAHFGDHFIAPGRDVRQKLIRFGFPPDKISVIPTFLPPHNEEQDYKAIPSYIWDFVKHHDPVLTANAFKISFFNGVDLYGIDMCVRLCARLKKQYPQIGLLFSLPNVGDYNYLSLMLENINKLGIEHNFFFISEEIELYPLLAHSRLFLRPTSTDSYGVSVAEAIYMGTPAVASDVCERPKGTALFHSRDDDDFEKVVLEQLRLTKVTQKEALKTSRTKLFGTDNFEALLEVYKTQLK